MSVLVELTPWVVVVLYSFICFGVERLNEWGLTKSDARGRMLVLAAADRAAVSIALTRERLRAGATGAYVRGIAHIDGGVLRVLDGTGVASAPLRDVDPFSPRHGEIRPLAAITDGSDVVLAGPATEDVSRAGDLRTAMPSIAFRATDDERVSAIVLRAA